MSLINKIDVKGGMVNCIEEGWVQSQIMDSAYKYQQEVETNKRTIVGVNRYLEEETENTEEITILNERSIKNQVTKLSILRQGRPQITNYLDRIEQKALTDENLMPHIIEAVSAKVTIGEICNSLRKVWGEYKSKTIL
jgi:methylmalonyl-CoA mutase N-terminal domain/subunit